MSDTIDSLSIRIDSEAQNAAGGLDKLLNTLNGIKQAVAPVTAELDRLRSSIEKISRTTSAIEKMTESFQQFRDTLNDMTKSSVYLTVEPMRDAVLQLADASKEINNVDFSGVLAIGNVFSTLSKIFEGTDMEIGEKLLQFTRQLKWGMVSLNDVGNSIDDGAMQKLSHIGTIFSQLSELSSMQDINTNGFANLASSISNAIGSLDGENLDSFVSFISKLSAVVNSIDDETLDRLSALGAALGNLQNVGSVRLNLPTADTASAGGASGFLSSLKKKGSALAGGAFGALGGALKTAYSGTSAVFKGLSSSLTWFTEKINPANGALGTFVKGLGRIAKYRLLRTIIKEITSGASEGLQNLAHASSEANAVLSQLSSASLTLKNSMGGMLYSAIAPNIGILTGLANAAIRAMDALSQLFAILGGRSTYKKATSATQSYADALKGATGRAKAFKQELMGFDEINALSPDNEYGGGSGSGSDLPDYGAMFQEAPVSEWLRSMVNAGDFSALGTMIADKINDALGRIDWNRVKGGARKLASSLTTLINGFFAEMNPATWGKTIGELINTATTFVGNFWRDTDWLTIGKRVQSMITNALFTIDAKQLAEAVMGKFRSLVSFLNGLLPDTKAEWDVITLRISEFIGYAIDQIPVDGISAMIRGLIQGALSLITSLAKGKTLTNLMTAIVNAIREAVKDIKQEDVDNALKALKDDILGALKAAFSLKINIGEMEFSAVGLVIGGAAIWNAIKLALRSVLTGTGFRIDAGSLMLLGTVGLGLTAATEVLDVIEGANKGTLDWKKIGSAIGHALMASGLLLASTFSLAGGLIIFGVGIGIKPVIENILDEQEVWKAADNLGKPFLDAINSINSVDLTGMQRVYDIVRNFSQMRMLDGNVIDTLLNFAAANMEGFDGKIDSITEMQWAVRYLFGEFELAKQKGQPWNEFMSEFTNGTITATGEIQSMTGATTGFIDEASGASQTVGELTGNLNNVPGAVQGTVDAVSELNGLDTSRAQSAVSGIGTSASDTIPSIKGMGDQAISTSDQIAEIPTDVALNIEITDYTTLISNLETIKTKVNNVITQADVLKLRFSNSLTDAIDTLQNKINTGLITALEDIQSTIRPTINALTNLQRTISSMHGATLSISVRAGLSSGAKNFLYQLGSVDYSARRYASALLSASQFASGGYPESGELFIANENGRQEMVGRIGNRTAVANQDQIGDAIFRYMDEHDRESGGSGPSADEIGSAVANALRRAGIGSVYLEGRDLAQAINKDSRRAGHPLINF